MGSVAGMGTFASFVGWSAGWPVATGVRAQTALLRLCSVIAVAVNGFWIFSAEPGQFARPHRTAQRAPQHLRERASVQALTKPSRHLLSRSVSDARAVRRACTRRRLTRDDECGARLRLRERSACVRTPLEILEAKTARDDPGKRARTSVESVGLFLASVNGVRTERLTRMKARMQKLSLEDVKEQTLDGDPTIAKLTRACGNNAAFGGLKIVTASGWFEARPSGTEDVYKIYAESFRGTAHLDALVREAEALVNTAIGGRP
jgi:Phosphoglucomutase/phosphomannomutase, C-terminal domain